MLKTDRSAEARLHLAGNVEMVEDRLFAFVEFDDLRALGSNQLQIIAHVLVDVLVVDLNRSEIRAEYVSDDTEGTTHLFADKAYGFFLLERFDGLLPSLH